MTSSLVGSEMCIRDRSFTLTNIGTGASVHSNSTTQAAQARANLSPSHYQRSVCATKCAVAP
eukprot:7054562-Prorocentrum_lima.AAC.1